MLSYHVARTRKHFHSFRLRLLSRLPRSRRALMLLLCIPLLLLLVVPHFPAALTGLHAIHFHAYRPYIPRLLSSSFSPPPLLPLSFPDTDIDRPPSLRKAYDDALTIHADHSSVYSPASYPDLDWAAVAEEDSDWADSSMPLILAKLLSPSSSSSSSPPPSPHTRAVLSSLLSLQFHPSDSSCSSPSSRRYLLYSFTSEFSATSRACLSTRRLQSLQKPPHRSANKVSSVREIIEQMEKAAKLREKLRAGKGDDREETAVGGLNDECRLEVLLDVARALLVAQASGRELLLLPVTRELCASPMGEGAGVAAATWMGCVWPQLLVRPSACGWADVKAIVDEEGYHEDAFSSSTVAVFRSLDHCYNSDAVFQRVQAALAPFHAEGADAADSSPPPRIGRLLLFQLLTRFLLTPAAPLQALVDEAQSTLFPSSSSPSSPHPPFLAYHSRYRASKDVVDLGWSHHPLLLDLSHTLVRHAAITGVREVVLWLEGDIPPTLLPSLQTRLPHLHLHPLHFATNNLSHLATPYAAALTRLLLLSSSPSGLLLSYASPIGRLLRQLRDDMHGGVLVDVEGDEWFHDCDDFSWHFYTAHTHDVAVQRQEMGVNAVMYPPPPGLPASSRSSSASSHSSLSLPPPPSVQVLVMIGISDREITPFASMFDSLACSGSSPPLPPFTAHPELSTLLQRMFNSPQTVDAYVSARMAFEQELQAEVRRVQSASSAAGTAPAIIRVDFVPWNVDRPFRAVLKADCAMLARFLQSLSTFLPIRLRLLLITREPASVLYTGTKGELAQLPSGMNSEWRYFFVARVLHDHLSALVGEVKAIHPSVYHLINVDDAILRTAHHAQQLAAFIERPTCARDIFRHLRGPPSPLLDVMEPTLEDLTVNEAAGGFDILTPLKYHGLFERAPSYSWMMEALTNHSAIAAVRASGQTPDALVLDELPLHPQEEVTRPAERELRLHVQGQQLTVVGEEVAVSEAALTDGDAVMSALDALHPQSSASCADHRFLVFDLFLRSSPCSCSNEPLPPSNHSLDEPPIAEAIRALGRTLSLGLTSGRTVLLPRFPSPAVSDTAVKSGPTAFLAFLSAACQPLSNCSLADAGLKLACHCASSSWLLSPITRDGAEPQPPAGLSSAFTPDRAVVGHAHDFHFGWLLRHNARRAQQSQLSSALYVSALHSYLFTCLSRNEALMARLSSYHSSLASPTFSPSSPTLAFSLPRSDLYTVSTYVGLIKRLMLLHGFHQLYLTSSCSLLYQHQHEDSQTGSRPPSCAEQRRTIQLIQEKLSAAHRRHLQFHPSSTTQLSILLSPRLSLTNASTVEDSLLVTLSDLWYTAQCHLLITTQASEEGLLLSELAYMQQRLSVLSTQGEYRLVAPPLYDLFGHTWLDGVQGSTLHHLLAYISLASPPQSIPPLTPTSDPTNTTSLLLLLPLPSPTPPEPPSVRKTVFSSSLRFTFIAGIEGAGHHFFESALGGTLTFSPWNPVGRANISRVKTSESGNVFYEDRLPNDPDVLGDGGRIDGEERTATASPGLISHPHFMLDLPLTRTVYEIFVHDSVDAYIDSRAKLITHLRELQERHREPPVLPEGVPFHPKRQPVLYPINHLGAAFGMHSYPNMFGADKMMHHPYLPTLAAIMEEAGVDFRVLLTVRSPQACHWSTVRRHHGEEVGADASYMFQARGLHDNLAYLDGDMRALDPAFVLQMHLTDVTRDPFRYAHAIAAHVGLEPRQVQTSLLALSHSFAVQPDGAWRSALNSSQLIAMKDAFDSSPTLSTFKHRYDALRGSNWGEREHGCRPPHSLKRRPRRMRRKKVGGERVEEEDMPALGVTLVSLEGSGDWMLRWMVEQLTGYLTGSIHGDATPGSKSDAQPRIVTSSGGRWSERGELLLVSQRKCAFHCAWAEEGAMGESSAVDHPPIAVYEPMQWATRLAPKSQKERDADKEDEVQRRDRERRHLIDVMEGPGAGNKYPLMRKLKGVESGESEGGGGEQRQQTGEREVGGGGDVDVGYAGDEVNDLIVLYRHPVDVAINLASLTLSNHFLHGEASRVSLNPIWSRWWKNSITKQAMALLQLTLQPIAHQYAHFLHSFPYMRTTPQHPGRRVLYLRYEDLFLHTERVIPQLLAFLRVNATEGRQRCVVERVKAMQVGVKVGVCSAGCGVATDGMEDESLDEVKRGHGRGLRVLTGLVEEATPAYPFKWLDLIEMEVWKDVVKGLTSKEGVHETMAQLGYLDDTQRIEDYIRSDPTFTWEKAQQPQQA